MITFNDVPAGIRTPLVAVEFDGSAAQAQSGAQPYKVLVIGQRLSTGTQPALEPVRITRAEGAQSAFGEGSMLHGMAVALFRQSLAVEAVFVAVDDPAGGAQATSTVTFEVASPVAGQVAVYVGGKRYSVPVSGSSTAEALAAALVSKVNADRTSYVTATASGGVATLTARHAGAAAGAMDLRHSYFDDENPPLGVTVTVGGFSGGSGDVDLTDVLAALPEDHYNVIAVPYTDSANLALLEAELGDRFGPTKSLDGLAICPSNLAFGALSSLGNARNSQHIVMPAATASPSPVWEWAAAVAMATAFEGQLDPARPLQTVALTGLMAPAAIDRMTRDERNLLLYDGVSTTVVNASGEVAIERLITTFQRNSQGVEDTAYLDVTTLLTLSYIRYDIRRTFSSKYGRHKVASEGTRIAPGQAVITPSVARAELISLARQWESLGIVEDVDSWKAGIIVERDADPSRLNFFIPPDLVNGLVVTAAKVGFGL